MENLFSNKEIKKLTEAIALEFQNRNLSCQTDFPRYVNSNSKDKVGKDCFKLYSLIIKRLKDKHFFKKLGSLKNSRWISFALWFGRENGKYNLEKVTYQLCAYLIQQKYRKLDDHIEHLKDNLICGELGIKTDKDLLASLSDNQLTLKNHGIIFKGSTLLYPHQFFRRFYSANFVGMPALLKKAHDSGASVKIRLDSFRKTLPTFYREIMEFDYWHGPQFSSKLLADKKLTGKTLHASHGYYCFSYEVAFTVFRTKMMDHSLREFTIEEYCPLNLPYGEKSPGVGVKFCIQKFAHFCYEQKEKKFTHLDGAVRVFKVNEYQKYFDRVRSGVDIANKVGIRHKLFLVEGKLDQDVAEELLTEWFRYNPHIQEYFSGINVDPIMTYEEFEKRHPN